MTKHLVFFLFIIPFSTLSSCSRKQTCENIFKTVHEKEQGFKKEWQLHNGNVISCTFLPVSYQICQQKNSNFTNQLIPETELQKEITFLIEIPYSEFSKHERYFMFDIESSVKLEQEEKKIRPLYCFLEQSYGLNGYQKIFIGFDKHSVDTESPTTLVIEEYLHEAINLRFDFELQELKL